jgi:hypothetical protein
LARVLRALAVERATTTATRTTMTTTTTTRRAHAHECSAMAASAVQMTRLPSRCPCERHRAPLFPPTSCKFLSGASDSAPSPTSLQVSGPFRRHGRRCVLPSRCSGRRGAGGWTMLLRAPSFKKHRSAPVCSTPTWCERSVTRLSLVRCTSFSSSVTVATLQMFSPRPSRLLGRRAVGG